MLFSDEIPFDICLYLLLSLYFSGNVVDSQSTKFDLGTLTLNSLKLLGDAHLSNGSLHLTRDLSVPNSGAGRILYSKLVRFRQPETPTASFSTFFSFLVTNLIIGGGLAFLISSDDETVGNAGGILGLVGRNAMSGFVAVELDTLMDVEFRDINGNHMGLDLNSLFSTQVGDLGAVNVELKNGDVVKGVFVLRSYYKGAFLTKQSIGGLYHRPRGVL